MVKYQGAIVQVGSRIVFYCTLTAACLFAISVAVFSIGVVARVVILAWRLAWR